MKIKLNQEYKMLVPRPSHMEYKQLKEDIKKFGQKIKIVVNQKMVIVDGYTRYQICQELRLKPKFVVKKFKNVDEELKYIISSNIHRRHLTAFQKVKSFKDVYEKMLENQKVGRTITRARKEFQNLIGVNQTNCTKALKVLREGDKDTIKKTEDGVISLDQAFRKVSNQKISITQTTCYMCGGKGRYQISEHEQRLQHLQKKMAPVKRTGAL